MGSYLQTASVALCRLTAILLLIPLSFFSSAQAINQPGEADQKVTIVSDNMTMAGFFKAIRKQTGLRVQYEPEVIFSEEKKFSVNFVQQPVSQVLNTVLTNKGIIWKIQNKVILLKKQNASTSTHSTTSATSDTLINTLIPIVSGKVTDAAGTPLSKVTVQVKDSRQGTTTNNNGEFALGDVKMGSELIVSSVGFQTREVPVLGKTILIPLQVKVSELDEAVIQAYGTTTRRLTTGSIGTVTAEEIAKQPVINPIEAIQGRVPGVIISKTTGYASAPFKIEIRGRNSLNDNLSGEPLYIVDDVPWTILEIGANNSRETGSNLVQNGFDMDGAGTRGQSPFVNLNPSDIESITVLKDADATAIYGSRGANGVILITTKKGKPGKSRYEVNVYTGISKVTRHWEMLNTKQYLEVRREAFYNDSIAYGIVPDPGSAPDLTIWDTTRYTNWQKYLLGNLGKTTDAQLSLSGGDKLTTFRIGVGYHREADILAVSGSDQKASMHLNLVHKSLNKKFTTSVTSLYSYYTNNLVNVAALLTLPPNAPAVFDGEGKLNYAGWEPVSDIYPFASILQPYSSKTGLFNGNLVLQYEIIKGLEISINFGYSTTNNSQSSIQPIASQNPRYNPLGRNSFGTNNARRWITEPQIEYKTTIGKGELSAFIGSSLQEVVQDGSKIDGSGITNDNLLRSVSNAPVTSAYDVWGQYKYAALFGRINYNWQRKYILNVSARRDGSSKFGPGKQYGNFGAAGAAWIFTEEEWFKKHIPVLSFGKIRASYGVTGSDNIGNYQYLTRWSRASIVPYQNSAAYGPLQHFNPNYQWESNHKLEAALNLGFLDDRHNIEIAWYRNRCGNQLVLFPLPILTGFGNVLRNLPATVQNTGLEILLNGSIVETKNFNWKYNFNIGINRNKLVAFPDIEKTSYHSRFFVGQTLNISRLIHYTGVDANTGLYTFEDKNKDGEIVIDAGPKEDLYNKDLSVKFAGGFGTGFTYKGVQLDLFFRFQKRLSRTAIYSELQAGGMVNQSIEVLNRWRKPGDFATFPRYTTLPTNDYLFTLSDGVYSDASFIRLQNLSISYNVSKALVSRLGFANCRLYLQGENLLVFTKYKGIDPEITVFGVMPPTRNLTAGVQFSF